METDFIRSATAIRAGDVLEAGVMERRVDSSLCDRRPISPTSDFGNASRQG